MPDLQDRKNLPENLQFLCRFRKSRSVVAREIGLNRQQFEKYLSGRAFPSSHVRQRIAAYFGISFESLVLPPKTFQEAQADLEILGAANTFGLPETSTQELAFLRHYVGAFQTYFLNPAWPGKIQAGVVFVREENRQISTIFYNRTRDPDTNDLHRSRLDGQLFLRGERLFLLEKTRGTEDRISETILYPPHRHSGKYLTGMSFGVTWRPYRVPFATRTIWRRLPQAMALRTVLQNCGIRDPDHRSLDPIVRKFMRENLAAYTI